MKTWQNNRKLYHMFFVHGWTQMPPTLIQDDN